MKALPIVLILLTGCGSLTYRPPQLPRPPDHNSPAGPLAIGTKIHAARWEVAQALHSLRTTISGLDMPEPNDEATIAFHTFCKQELEWLTSTMEVNSREQEHDLSNCDFATRGEELRFLMARQKRCLALVEECAAHRREVVRQMDTLINHMKSLPTQEDRRI